MATKYRKISTAIWNDAKVRGFSLDAKLALLFMLTHATMSHIGALRGNPAGLAYELKMPVERFETALAEIEQSGMVKRDDEAGLFWFPNFLRYNEPESPNVVRAWIFPVEYLPECDLRTEALRHAWEYLQTKAAGFRDAFRERFAEYLPECSAKDEASLPDSLAERLPEGLPKAFPKGFPKGCGQVSPNPEPEPDPEPSIKNTPLTPSRGSDQPEEKKAGRKSGETARDIKAAIDSLPAGDELKQALHDFAAMRRNMHCPLTLRALEETRRTLGRLYPDSEAQQTASVAQSIQRGWRGVFALKDEGNGAQTTPSQPVTMGGMSAKAANLDAIARMVREAEAKKAAERNIA